MEEVYKALSLLAAAAAAVATIVAPCCCSSFVLTRYFAKATLYGRYILLKMTRSPIID